MPENFRIECRRCETQHKPEALIQKHLICPCCGADLTDELTKFAKLIIRQKQGRPLKQSNAPEREAMAAAF
jgi:PHP family Zn ribbon phosphoesterase